MLRIVTKWLKLWDTVRRRRDLPDALPGVATCPRDEDSQIHPDALLILYGWHMHKAASGRYAFPPKTERSIATSFHVSNEAMLTPAAVEYLRCIGPVGCRDLSTLRKLRAKQVPSFYSGCVTLTLPKAPVDRRRSGSVAVDTVSPDPRAATLAMWAMGNRELSQRQMWLRAICVLRLLRRTAIVYSSRLHVLYPSLAMGTQAIIQSPTGDTREDWGAPGRWETARLYASGAKNHVADAKRLERQLAIALGRILAGENITRAWRRAVVIHVAFCFDSGFAIPTLACANSLLCHNGERPLLLHFFHRDVMPSDIATMQQRLLSKHPGTMMEFHKCEGDSTKGYATHLPHVSAQTMERLWLHEKLPDVDRLIYIDGDMIIRGSIDYLFDKRVPVIAARNSIENIMLSESWNRRLGYTGSSCFNAGLLIMNLAALRRMDFTGFVKKVLALQSCNDQTILNLFCQGQHTPLPAEYNYFCREPRDMASSIDPIIIHYCGSRKPWTSDKIHMGAEWHKYRL
jgi:lipopolysaccharide biosynthesis glycosyltransferase